jgi:hypothetical protein
MMDEARFMKRPAAMIARRRHWQARRGMVAS